MFKLYRGPALARLAPRVPVRYVAQNSGMSVLEHRINDTARELEERSSARSSKGNLAEDTVNYGDSAHLRPDLARLRVVPRDRAFYMMNPPHEEVMRRLNELIQTYINLPTVQTKNTTSTWLSFEDYRSRVGAMRLRPTQYKQFIKLANRLNNIDPQVMPIEVEDLLAKLKSENQQSGTFSLINKLKLDQQGRAVAVGHRKTSSARVMVAEAREGTVGQILVNGKPLTETFVNEIYRRRIVYPLEVVEGVGKYNVFATVQGGGITGQADAVAHGLGKALRIQNPLLGPRLRHAGCVKRDLREKERKKPGLAKARKAYTWVKR